MLKKIRIVIADDHTVIQMGLKELLHQHNDFIVVGEASSGEEAIEQALLHRPDIVVMDIQMKGMSGIDACRQITTQLPNTRVVILTSYAEEDLIFSAVRAGASGYVLKRIGSEELTRTIHAVANGESGLDAAQTEAMFKRLNASDKVNDPSAFSELSTQELRVLALIKEGATNRAIAGRLFLGEGTVRNYVSSMLSKLHLANRAEAAAYAVQHRVEDYVTFDEHP